MIVLIRCSSILCGFVVFFNFFYYSIATKDDVTFGNVNVGDVKIDKNGINAGNKPITNVATGKADTDAVNLKQLKDTLPVVEAGKNVTVTTTGANGNPIYTINATSSKGSGIEVHSKQVGDNFINGQGTTVSVTNNGDIKVDSPMAYIGNKNPNDTSTATNTVELVGKDNQKDTVQITKVASGLRKPDENMEVGSKLSAQDLVQRLNLASGETLNHAVNVGDLQGVSNNLNNSITNLSNQLGDINQRLGDVSNHANAGISSAMAMASLPQAYL